MDSDKIREAFLNADIWDFTSVFDHNETYRYQYVDYLEAAMQSSQEEIERLKKENEDLRCCGNCKHGYANTESLDDPICRRCMQADNWEAKG